MGNYADVELTLLGEIDEVRLAYEEITTAHDNSDYDNNWANCECDNCWLWTAYYNHHGCNEMRERGAFFAYASHLAIDQDDVRHLSAKYPRLLVYVQDSIWYEAFYFVNGALLRQDEYKKGGADVDLALHLLAGVNAYLGHPQPAAQPVAG